VGVCLCQRGKNRGGVVRRLALAYKAISDHLMKKIELQLPIIISCILLNTFIVAGPISALAERTPYDWANIHLDFVLQEKVEQLERFMVRVHTLAQKAAQDQVVVSFFEINSLYHNSLQSKENSESLDAKVEKARQHFNGYYIANYFIFYDILFVDMDGGVLHTLRKEKDRAMNLIDDQKSLGLLGQAVARKPNHEVFVDFYNYGPSSEPAAFFIEPVKKENVQIGWIILQCPINKLNSIFAATDDLGQSGETFLVNSQGLMLTESYFKGQSTILKEQLDDRNIKVKFSEEKGHRVVTDYRGAVALSSFELFSFLDTRWLVVAKIDKDEITTDHYKRHKRYYGDMLVKYFQQMPPGPSSGISSVNHPSALRVDMDEFLKAENNQALETWGVSTCTALVAALPEKFAYLAHISPKDRIYDQDDTNLVSQIIKKVKSFDIYPFERRGVVFTVVAPHLKSLPNIIGQLIDNGFLLSQIRMAYNSKAHSAALVYQYDKNDLAVTWTMDELGDTPKVYHDLQDTLNVGTILEEIIAHENNM
jgi:hypothetical protein